MNRGYIDFSTQSQCKLHFLHFLSVFSSMNRGFIDFCTQSQCKQHFLHFRGDGGSLIMAKYSLIKGANNQDRIVSSLETPLLPLQVPSFDNS